MPTDKYQGSSARHWTVRLRLAIETSDADAARTINKDVLQKMGVVAEAEPQLTKSASPQPCWYVITKLDLSGLETITPDDAQTRFRFVIRQLPGVSFGGQGGTHGGLWQWLPDEWGSDGRRLFPHPAVRAAGIHIAGEATPEQGAANARIPVRRHRGAGDERQRVHELTSSMAKSRNSASRKMPQRVRPKLVPCGCGGEPREGVAPGSSYWPPWCWRS